MFLRFVFVRFVFLCFCSQLILAITKPKSPNRSFRPNRPVFLPRSFSLSLRSRRRAKRVPAAQFTRRGGRRNLSSITAQASTLPFRRRLTLAVDVVRCDACILLNQTYNPCQMPTNSRKLLVFASILLVGAVSSASKERFSQSRITHRPGAQTPRALDRGNTAGDHAGGTSGA